MWQNFKKKNSKCEKIKNINWDKSHKLKLRPNLKTNNCDKTQNGDNSGIFCLLIKDPSAAAMAAGKKKDRWYYTHQSRDSLSPICGIFLKVIYLLNHFTCIFCFQCPCQDQCHQTNQPTIFCVWSLHVALTFCQILNCSHIV